MNDIAHQGVDRDDIAVIGLSCRLPGAADPVAFWRLLAGGVDAVTPTPAARWDAGAVFDEDLSTPGTANTRWGGFIDDVDRFDAEFFGISPREAEAMDPQQRLMLELAWEALENAGVVPASLAERSVGVFAGAIGADYATLAQRQGLGGIGHHTVTGLSRGLIANRVSYVLGLRGPSFTVDSAQSSALVAVHVACESLRSGESELALAGGVHLNLVPDSTVGAAKFGGLSPDGRCHAFDARANGYVRGEGGGLVVLKPLAKAIADGDVVHSVIRGSAINNDGASDGLTTPDAAAQEAVLRRAYQRAGVDPSEVQYVELHGTGTKVGDPIEARALGAVFADGREDDSPLHVGSAKTNVGHLEGAAGIVGLLKTVLALRHGQLPPSLHFDRVNPDIPLDALRLRVQRELQEWDVPAEDRLAGVNSFGMGGSNCHVVLAGPPRQAVAAPGGTTPAPSGLPVPWVLSAKNAEALRGQAAKLRSTAGDLDVLGVAGALLSSRTLFDHRAVVLGPDRDALLSGLADLDQGLPGATVVTGVADAGATGPVLVFPGQGAQWAGMGRELLDASPVFAASVARCERALAPHVDWSLTDVLRTGALLDRVDVVQPASWAVMVSLAALWESVGIVPHAVLGHSQGEIAAATVAGALSVEDAARVVALRSKVIAERLAGRGAMASVALPADEVLAHLDPHPGVSIAVVNGPGSTVVSGDPDAIDVLVDRWKRSGARARRVAVDYASHSPHVDSVRDELLDVLAGVTPRNGRVPFYSTVRNTRVDGDRLDAGYWVENLREPVRFGDAVRALLDDGVRIFIESSSHPVLATGIEDTAGAAEVLDAAAIGSLRRDEGGLDRFLRSVAEAFVRGAAVDWAAVAPEVVDRAVGAADLPTYAFQKKRYWVETTEAPAVVSAAARPVERVSAPKRRPAALDLVRAHAAVVLRAAPEDVHPKRSFKELGFDSIMAVELRNRLNAATGQRLPTSAVFDHPTPTALARVIEPEQAQAAPEDEAVVQAQEDDPIVVVGMGCRFPGGISSPEELWRLVTAGEDAIGDYPADRGWDVRDLSDTAGFARVGGFLHEAPDFDAEFFGISPREALAMDPQQRLLLETSWEALERAGIDPESLRESRTGVFAGAMAGDYGPRLHQTPDSVAGYLLTGAAGSVTSGRVAYALGLEGPAMSIDTACSSSLVALHLAVQALRQGECTLALAGGVTVMSTLGMFAEFSRQGGLAADGRCKAFSADADGTGWSEGVGVLVVEKLSDARRNGHEVLAVVKGTAVNQDGASNGLTAPNGPSQQRVIRQALTSAGLSTSDIDVVEAHGTGTALGDPIEAQALLATYGQERERPLWLGSLKSNIGHTQAAAGVAGVIKMIMAMRHGIMPRTLHADQPSPHVDWTSGAVELLTSQREWPERDGVRRAAVSSFGISGTNAHVIVEQHENPTEDAAPSDAVVPWVLSAKTPGALAAQAGRLHVFVGEHPELGAADVGLSLACGRAVFDHRATVLGGHLDGLAALAEGRPSAGVVRDIAKPEGGTAFLFTGQGAQRLGMGRELHTAFPAFADAFDTVVAELDKHLDRSLREVMWGEDAALLDRTEFTQPALFAIEVALFHLVRSWGIEPDHLSGHSIGELSAAHAAGVLTLADAAALVAARGRLMQALPAGGAMVAVQASADEVLPQASDLVSVAAVNGPDAVVLAGDEAEVLRLAAGWAERGRKTRRLTVSHAFHSPLMAPMLDGFRQVAERLTYTGPTIPLTSNLAGAQDFSADHWVRHVSDTVAFADGVRRLREQGVTRFVELGPDGVLTAMAQSCLTDTDQVVVPALRRDRPEPDALALAVGALHASGVEVDWAAYFASTGAHPVDLPTYAFQRERFWLAPAAAAGDVASAGLTAVAHPLLAAAVELDADVVLTGRLSADRVAWLPDHRVGGSVVVPGTALLEMAARAGEHVGLPKVEELVLLAPLVAPADVRVRVRSTALELYSRRDGEEVLHATAQLSEEDSATGAALTAWPPKATSVDLDDLYQGLAERGLDYGPAFRGVRSVWRGDGELFAEVALPTADDAADYLVHPALLDAVLHPVAAGELLPDSGSARVPFAWSAVRVHAVGASVLRVRMVKAGPDAVALTAWDAEGAPVLDAEVVLRAVSAKAFTSRKAPLHRMTWLPAPLTPAGEPGRVVALADVAQVERLAGFDGSSVRDGLTSVLALVQSWLADQDGDLVLVTRDAETDPAQAAVWGLVRSAQTEHPGRLRLVDVDTDPESDAVLPSVLASAEPQVSVRSGVPHTPRLERVDSPTVEPTQWGASSLLVTGAGGVVGSALARHAVATRQVGHVVLSSRRGVDGPGVAELSAQLRDLGASVVVEACDAADRDQVAAMLARVPAEFPLRGVIHAAGAVADAVVDALTPDHLEAVLGSKTDAVVHLDELTRGMDLEWFVACSSVAGWWGTAGQANYAAANACVDALVRRRREAGFPALSLAWGLWEERSGMSGHLGRADIQRMARVGIAPLATANALTAFDAALAAGDAVLAPAELDVRGASADALPPFLATKDRTPRRARAAATTRSAVALDRDSITELVRSHAAAVLGHAELRDDQLEQAFSALGVDSLTALELRNQLTEATGLRLPTTLLFDHPTPLAVVDHLVEELSEPEEKEVVSAVSSDEDDPVVIVGMGCRYPSGVASPDDLWDLVLHGRDGVSPFPTDRGWDLETLFGDDPSQPGTSYAREGGFLHEAPDFDAAFFGISPREALATDPQQRLLLETSWEALERAGIDPKSLKGTPTGVFAGVMYHDYASRLRTTPEGLEGFLSNGSLGSVASGRVSYVLGLEGPAVSVDTACSSSLVALHLASQALRQGECSLALVGGVTVMSTPSTFIDFSRQRALSSDGRCKAFSADADGTGWAEGVGVLVVEKLSDARRNGHRVLAVVKGTAINQDGASNGLTAPNGPAQQRVIRQALANAGLSTSDVDLVEAHGTGTALGDPIEAQALLATYGQERERPLWLGSLKSNIGHSQAAAGVGGIIKVVMAMRHGVMPRTLHADRPSPHVDWTSGAVELLTSQREWPERDGVRRAAVSSFGISGTNAHVIVEQPVEDTGSSAEVEADGALVPWVLSGRTRDAVAGQAAKLLEFMVAHPDTGVLDVADALLSRSLFEHRVVVLGGDRDVLAGALGDAAHGQPGADVVSAPAGKSGGRTAFLFAGQGSQRPGMGRELRAAFPVFAAAFDEACAELDKHLDRSVRSVVFDDPEALDRTEFTQPALFALEVALFRLVESWGVRPSHLAGHSIGEIAAAHVAGVLSLADAAALVAARGRLMQELPAGGAMVAVRAPESEVAALLAGQEDRVGIAAVNGPVSVVLSGDEAVVSAIAERLRARGRKTRALRVSHAFHSPLMEPMLDRFRAVVEGLDFAEPTLPLVSTVTGAPAGPGDFTTADYWVRHVRAAVRFQDGVRALEAAGVRNFLELGPDGVLSAMAADCLSDTATATLLPLLRKDKPENRSALDAVARLFVRGAAVDWTAVLPDGARRPVDLPTYAFQRERFWLDAGAPEADVTSFGMDAVDHPLVSGAMPMPDGGVLLTGRISTGRIEWLADHEVGGAVLVPGTAMLEMVVQAGEQVGCERVEELTFHQPMVLPGDRSLDVRLLVAGPGDDGHRQVELHSRPVGGDDWTRHASGGLSPHAVLPVQHLVEWPPAGAEPVEIDGLHDDLAAGGLVYGPAFRGLRALWRGDGSVYAEIHLPEPRDAARYLLHPALLDAALHPLAMDRVGIPLSWTGTELRAVGASVLRVRLTTVAEYAAEVTAWDADGAPVFAAEQIRLWPVSAEELRAIAAKADDALFRMDWEALPPQPELQPHPANRRLPVPVADGAEPDRVRVVLRSVLDEVRAWLAGQQEAGARLVLVTRGAMDEAGTDPAHAAVWGLVRSAQAEHPGRLQLVDLDDDPASAALLPAVMASAEPQVVVRAGGPLVPRLAKASAGNRATGGRWATSSLLVTGAGGVVGSALAKHAVTTYGVKHLVLTSRRGEQAPGMTELAADLRALGASVSVEACDAADRDQLAAVLDRVPRELPLRGVIHAAGVSRDKVFTELTSDELEAVLPAKVDAVVNLDELTRDSDLDWFVVCSSAAGWWGNAGQANYAAANATVDALVRARRTAGHAALSLAWGLWEERSELSSHLGRSDLERLARIGIAPLATVDALAAFDAALRSDEAVLAPVRLDTRTLVDTESAPLNPLLRKHVRKTGRAAASGRPTPKTESSPAVRFAGMNDGDLYDVLLELVRAEVAAVLNHADPDAVEVDRAFFDVGLDSLTALELRNRVEKAVGLSLPPTAIFDHASPAALAKYLQIRLGEDVVPPAVEQVVAKAAPESRPLAGTTVLLTGATGGLGGVFAEALAGAGANLVLTGRQEQALDAVAGPLREAGAGVLTVPADVLDRDVMARVVEEATSAFGGVDVLVNNAGVTGPVGPLWETDDDEWWQAMEVNLRGTVRACRAVLPGMVDRGSGRIINVVSSAGKHRWPHLSGYSVSKAAVIKLAENMAPELEGTGVSVVSFHPGLVDLGITREGLDAERTGDVWRDQAGDWLRSQRDNGRLTTPEQSVEALLRLASGQADSLSGSYLTPEDDVAAMVRSRRIGG